MYRVRPVAGSKFHLVRAGDSGVLATRSICGTRLPVGLGDVKEFRGIFGRDGDCGRCQRVRGA